MGLNFVLSYEDRFGRPQQVELVERGSDVEVTNENKVEYIRYARTSLGFCLESTLETRRLVTHWHLYGYATDFLQQFVKGFHSVILTRDLWGLHHPDSLTVLLDVDRSAERAYIVVVDGDRGDRRL